MPVFYIPLRLGGCKTRLNCFQGMKVIFSGTD